MPRPEIVTSVAKRETDLAALKSDRLLEANDRHYWTLNGDPTLTPADDVVIPPGAGGFVSRAYARKH